MASTTDKSEDLPDLDDLLQCPVCYEIPSGQILQCNEGHHVCGRCKARLDLCPVCRSLFFGTRNYALEELIANIRKLQAFKLGGKMTVTSGSGGSESTASAENSIIGGTLDGSIDEDSNRNDSSATVIRPSPCCKGLFRCLCCKNGATQRLPAGRLLNHLRYFHAPELIEGKSENGAYIQAWEIPTVPGRIVIAVRVVDMGIFFLVIEIENDNINAWVSMGAAPWIANEYWYTIAISGNDREAIFTDCVWSVRACEGALKKRGRCLVVSGQDARALTAAASVSGRLELRPAPADPHMHPVQPRAVLRVANRSAGDDRGTAHDAVFSHMFEILDVSERDGEPERARDLGPDRAHGDGPPPRGEVPGPVAPAPPPPPADRQYLSRNARRRMRQRLLNALNELGARPSNDDAEPADEDGPPPPEEEAEPEPRASSAPPDAPAPAPAPAAASSSAGGHRLRNNKKKRRHRR